MLLHPPNNDPPKNQDPTPQKTNLQTCIRLPKKPISSPGASRAQWESLRPLLDVEPKVGPWNGGTNLTLHINTTGWDPTNINLFCIFGDSHHQDLRAPATITSVGGVAGGPGTVNCISSMIPSWLRTAGGVPSRNETAVANVIMVSLRYYTVDYAETYQTNFFPFAVHKPLVFESVQPRFGYVGQDSYIFASVNIKGPVSQDFDKLHREMEHGRTPAQGTGTAYAITVSPKGHLSTFSRLRSLEPGRGGAGCAVLVSRVARPVCPERMLKKLWFP